MTTNFSGINQTAERLFIRIEDQITRMIIKPVLAALRGRATASSKAPARSGRQLDAELARESRNPVRGWRWV